jgi:ribosomal protein S18 acetylase RimI-like enzyme
MVLAFAGDPVARWMYRDPQRYLVYFGQFMRAFAGKAFSTGTAWCIDGISEVRCGFRQGRARRGGDSRRLGRERAARRDGGCERHVHRDGGLSSTSIRIGYLPTIGIEPHVHRMGLGSALIAEALRRCDQEHMPAYLESSNPANATFYRRLGFEPSAAINSR